MSNEVSSRSNATELMQVFNYGEAKVRTIMIDGEPWFVGKDVAGILGYSNTRDALSRHVDDEDKNTVVIHDGISGNPNQVVINESGLYSLILSSKLPTAKQFKRWVTSEVLPAIRKDRMYLSPDVFEDPDFIMKILVRYKQEREERIKQEKAAHLLADVVAEQIPKVAHFNSVYGDPNGTTVTDIGRLYGRSGRQMNQLLKDLGLQFYDEDYKAWIPTKKATCARVRTGGGRGRAYIQTKWCFNELQVVLAENGIEPIFRYTEEAE